MPELASRSLSWLDNNVVHPAINVGLITPYNALANVVDSASQKLFNTDFLQKKDELHVEAARFGTTEWAVQNISGALAMTLPYGIAAKGTGGVLRSIGANAGMEGLAANVMRSEITAQALGAAAYGAIQVTKPGETWYGNSISAGVGFGIFGVGNHYSGSLSTGARIAARAGTGALGAVSQTALNDGISQGRLATGEELTQSALSGAAMNVALPAVQRTLTRGVDAINVKAERGVPIDRFVESNANISGAAERSSLLSDLIQQYPWARVQPSEATNSANASKNLVHVDGTESTTGAQATRLAHELDHLGTQPNLGNDPLIIRSRELISSDPEASWQHFREARLQNELSALQTEHTVGNQLGLQDSAFDAAVLRQTIPGREATPGFTYEQLWKGEYNAFADSGGLKLPHLDYRANEIELRSTRASERQMGIALLAEPAFEGFMDSQPDLLESMAGQEKILRSFKPKLQGSHKETPLVKEELRRMYGEDFVTKSDRAEDVSARINDQITQLNKYRSTISRLGTSDPLTPRDILNVEQRSRELGFAIPDSTRVAIDTVKDATINLSPAAQALVGKYRIAGESGAPFDLRAQLTHSDTPHHVISDVLNTPTLARMVESSGMSRESLQQMLKQYESALGRRAQVQSGEDFIPPAWKGKIVTDEVIHLKLTPDGQLDQSVYRQAQEPLREMFGGKPIPREVDRFFKDRPAGLIDESYAVRLVKNSDGDLMMLRMDPSYNQNMAKGYLLFVDSQGRPLENTIHLSWAKGAANPSVGADSDGIRSIKRDLPGNTPKEIVYTSSNRQASGETWLTNLDWKALGFGNREQFLKFAVGAIQQS